MVDELVTVLPPPGEALPYVSQGRCDGDEQRHDPARPDLDLAAPGGTQPAGGGQDEDANTDITNLRNRCN
jgi:hypothetical protein